MVIKKDKPKINKEVLKEMAKPKVSKKAQRYVAARNLDKMKAKGWKVVKPMVNDESRTLGIKAHCDDLTLMEK